ncbi:DUF2975 domain-containing protein [Pedobacter gandavensis]|uniref:DUF2975 domain-containing protein n=1 Tax=Pedobacter gandavensis TaxID=2679963 RepID=A0ABR6EV28_9SPHI|nr:DUF2975 domain-containing protein [Pedobacter gandavensis]MBB2149094.1 DUF2975 domain-containing protein [Pedobacter gandavensis]
MRKDLKFIRIIRGILLLISVVLLIWAVYDHRSAMIKGWYADEELKPLQPRFQNALFGAVISKPGDSLNIKGKDGYVFKLEKSDLVTGTVYNLHQESTLYSIYKTAMLVIGFTLFIISFKVFSKLYYFLDDSAKGEIFTLKNINRIKDIGFFCISLSILLWVGDVLAFLRTQELVRFTDYQMEYNFDFNYILFAAGMVTMVIMYVFKKGYDLQQEHELTI